MEHMMCVVKTLKLVDFNQAAEKGKDMVRKDPYMYFAFNETEDKFEDAVKMLDGEIVEIRRRNYVEETDHSENARTFIPLGEDMDADIYNYKLLEGCCGYRKEGFATQKIPNHRYGFADLCFTNQNEDIPKISVNCGINYRELYGFPFKRLETKELLVIYGNGHVVFRNQEIRDYVKCMAMVDYFPRERIELFIASCNIIIKTFCGTDAPLLNVSEQIGQIENLL